MEGGLPAGLRPLGPIFLVGFMGAGKSRVGAALADRLGVPFLDLDAEIERSAGQTIRVLFETEGEARFRARESRVLESLAPTLSARPVVATGGGLFADPAHRAWISERGRSVWLDAPPDLLWSRCQEDESRPLRGQRDAFEALLEARRPAYALADLTIFVGGLSVADVVERILGSDKLRSGRPRADRHEGG